MTPDDGIGLATEFRMNREGYTEAKTAFIEPVLAQATKMAGGTDGVHRAGAGAGD